MSHADVPLDPTDMTGHERSLASAVSESDANGNN